MTRKQFISQFPHKVNPEGIRHLFKLYRVIQGVKVYTALNLLFIKIGDNYYH